MKYYNIDQNTDMWMALRLGKFTASALSSLLMGKSTAGYNKAIQKCAYERKYNESPDDFKASEYMERGHELEQEAREYYEALNFTKVLNGGFFELSEWVGASPDGLIDKDGLVEIKCPAWNTILDYKRDPGKLTKQYNTQVQSQLFCTERKWCDLFAYHPKIGHVSVRVKRDDIFIKNLEKEIETGIVKVNEYLETL